MLKTSLALGRWRMSALSYILNDSESTQFVPKYRQAAIQTTGSFSDEPNGNVTQPFLPPASLLQQQNHNTSLTVSPFAPVTSQSLCRCGSERLTSTIITCSSTEAASMSGWAYRDSLLVPSLLDSFAAPVCDQLNKAMLTPEVDFHWQYDHSNPAFQVCSLSITGLLSYNRIPM